MDHARAVYCKTKQVFCAFLNLLTKLSYASGPAQSHPFHARNFQGNLLGAQRVGQILAIFLYGIRGLIAPPENGNATQLIWR